MLNKILSALAITAFVGIAAAQAPTEQKGESATPPNVEQKKDANKRHDHARDQKQGAPASANAKTGKAPKKPLHDHRKEHKQG